MNDYLHIVIDTREQRPWSFPEHLAYCSRGTLKTGDYALAGYEENFAIERKSLDDFLGTLSSGWARFCRELKRMEQFQAKVIIVEGDFAECCFSDCATSPAHNHPKLTPQFVASRIAYLAIQGVAVLFAGNADYAAALAYHTLKHYKRQMEGI